MRGYSTRILFLALGVCWVADVSAKVCSVPTLAHPSVQAAVDDAACTEIVLAAQEYVGSVGVSRSLLLRGASSATTTILGQVTVTGASTEITLQDLKVDGGGCFTLSLDVSGGAQVTSGPDVVVANAEGGACPIFTDGFELGATVAWAATVT
jgi:hypothetical protein